MGGQRMCNVCPWAHLAIDLEHVDCRVPMPRHKVWQARERLARVAARRQSERVEVHLAANLVVSPLQPIRYGVVQHVLLAVQWQCTQVELGLGADANRVDDTGFACTPIARAEPRSQE